MKRKNIAVCVTGYDKEYESLVINSIYARCMELDINLLVFSSLIRKPELNTGRTLAGSVVRGESEVFNLINYDILDGIVVLGSSLVNEESVFVIDRKAREKSIPTVNINDPEHVLQKNIQLSDSIAMQFVVEHLVTDHGLTRINFIGGFPGNLQTEDRLAAYKKVLANHGIPVRDDQIAYGKFWKEAAECTEQFMASDEKPQAIVCANDSMAFFSVNWLKEHGYSVPDDIIVTGFDGIADSGSYTPSITTVRKAFDKAGALAVDVICDIAAGKEVPDNIYADSVLEKRQSCGCVPVVRTDSSSLYSRHYDDLNKTKEFNAYILEMNTRFASATSSQELFLDTLHGAKFFGLNRMYICIGSDIEGSEPSLENRTHSRFNGICETMVSMLKYGHDVPVGTEFRSSDLLPEDILHGDKAVFIAFSPLYFKDDFLGYIAYEPTRVIGSGELFPTWIMQISNNAGSFYMNNELRFFVDKLESLYLCDPLTGLYNRRGLDRLGRELLNKAKERNTLFTVVCADIDHLKPINDVYGHEAGDNAILQTANAIRKAISDDLVCVRTGGDEYCILISHTSEQTPGDFSERVGQILDEYNRTSGLPYNISCSCGWSTANARDLETYDQLSAQADENMYRAKMARKAARCVQNPINGLCAVLPKVLWRTGQKFGAPFAL